MSAAAALTSTRPRPSAGAGRAAPARRFSVLLGWLVLGCSGLLLLLSMSKPAAAFKAPPLLLAPSRQHRRLPATPLKQQPSVMLCGSRLLVHRIRSKNAFTGSSSSSSGVAPRRAAAAEGGDEVQAQPPAPPQQQQQKQPGGRRNRPPVLNKLSAILARFRTFIR